MDEPADKSALDSIWRKAAEAAEIGDCAGVLFLLRSLAEKGAWQALARIGELYEAGGGNLEKNLTEAVKWYQKSIFECDDPVAHLGLGRIYFSGGDSISQNIEQAIFHFQKAYLNRMPQAGIYLGIAFYFGIGVERDPKEAREYFRMAADNDYFLAYAYLSRIEFTTGHFIRGAKLACKSWWIMARLIANDPDDPRLLGIERRNALRFPRASR